MHDVTEPLEENSTQKCYQLLFEIYHFLNEIMYEGKFCFHSLYLKCLFKNCNIHTHLVKVLCLQTKKDMVFLTMDRNISGFWPAARLTMPVTCCPSPNRPRPCINLCNNLLFWTIFGHFWQTMMGKKYGSIHVSIPQDSNGH